VASAVDDADLPTVERLFRLRDMFTRAERAYRREPLMDGRKGGTIVNPVWKVLRDTAAELRQLEARFGITPQARFQLGITFSEARKRSLEDRIRDLQEDEEEQDPRLKPVK
jgi:P27 family predicted phage terminase small subunit